MIDKQWQKGGKQKQLISLALPPLHCLCRHTLTKSYSSCVLYPRLFCSSPLPSIKWTITPSQTRIRDCLHFSGYLETNFTLIFLSNNSPFRLGSHVILSTHKTLRKFFPHCHWKISEELLVGWLCKSEGVAKFPSFIYLYTATLSRFIIIDCSKGLLLQFRSAYKSKVSLPLLFSTSVLLWITMWISLNAQTHNIN